jgi:hypothetical protein
VLKTARGTQALLDLEDRRPDVLFEHVDGSPVPLWPQLRGRVAVALDELDYRITAVAAPEPARSSAWSGLARSFLPSRWDAAFARGRTPLCFLLGGTTVHAVGGRARNWLIGDFAELNAERSSVLQWASLPSRLGPPWFSATWSLDPLSTRSAGFARLSRRDPESKVRAIVTEVVRQLDVPLREEQIAAILASAVYHERVRPHIDRGFARVLDRLGPAVVVMEDASYGSAASIISMMKDRGIVVAEPQHGWIGPTHAAYNFGAAMYSEPLRRTLPDELLTFGAYWSRGLRYPVPTTVVGKPYLETMASRAQKPVESEPELLIVSSAADPDEMADFVLRLRAELDSRWSIVFRPHPAELPSLRERYPRLVGASGVRIDDRSDVYESLAAASAVIGVASTVLFEALEFGCAVFVRASPFVDYYVGDLFGPPIDGPEGIARVASSLATGEFKLGGASVPTSEIWASGGVERFQAWLGKHIEPN